MPLGEFHLGNFVGQQEELRGCVREVLGYCRNQFANADTLQKVAGLVNIRATRANKSLKRLRKTAFFDLDS